MPHHKRHRIKWRRAGCQCGGKYDKNLGNVKPKLAERMREAARASWYWLGVLLVLLPVRLYAQGAGTPPYRGVNNWPLIFGTDNVYDIGASGGQRPRTGYFATSVVTPALTISGLTAARIPFSSSGGVLSSDAGLTYDGTTLEVLDKFNASGPNAATNVEIGSTSSDAYGGTAGTSVVIGNGATNTANGNGAVIIGSLAAGLSGGIDSIAIGRSSSTVSHNAIAIGPNSTADLQGLAVGVGASANINSIALGLGATASGIGQLVVGSPGAPVTDVFFGMGRISGAPVPYTISGTAGFNADVIGGSVYIRGGLPTGSARGGSVILQAAPSGPSSGTPNAAEDRFYIVPQRFTLTDNAIATFGTMLLGDDTAGGGTISYCVVSRNATTTASECGEVDFGGADVTDGAGGEVCPTPTKHGTPLQVLSGATLTVTFAASTGTDLCNLRVTADTSVSTPVALYIVWNASNPGGRTLTPQ